MALSEADLERARRAAENAPELTPGQKERLRSIFAACTSHPRDHDKQDQGDAASAA